VCLPSHFYGLRLDPPPEAETDPATGRQYLFLSQVLKTDDEDMQNRAHDCFFSAAHAAKDSGIAYQLAVDTGLNLPLAKATKEQYDRMVALGLGSMDKSGVAELTFKGRNA